MSKKPTSETLEKRIQELEKAEALYKRTIETLQASEAKFRKFVEASSDWIWEVDYEGVYTYSSPQVEKILGYKPEEVIGKTPFDLMPPNEAKRIAVDFGVLVNAGKPIISMENTNLHKNGRQIVLETSGVPITDSEGKTTGYRGIDRDITDRKKTETALKDSEKRYRAIFAKSTDAIFIVERNTGKYIDVNEAGERLTGRNLSGLKQLSTEVIVPEGAHDRLKKIGKSNEIVAFDRVKYVRPDGTNRIAILSSVPIDDETVIGIAHDITEELAMEDKLRQAHKMEAIGTLAGGIAHDFNNILSAILGYSELLLAADLNSNEYTRNKIEAIYSSGKRARDLVAQILTFSRKDEQVRVPIKLHLIIEEALKLIRPATPSTIDIITHIHSKCLVLGDPTRIHQVIMNLSTNAYHSMLETGGTIEISLSKVNIKEDTSTLTQIPAGTYSKLVVSDTGIGISPENIERIFEPYFTTKEKGKGTGLGLASAHGIIKSHGGSILVESEIGKGTKFIIFLPMIKSNGKNEVQTESKLIGGNEQILIVDDESDILDVQMEMLKILGYKVIAKNSAKEALEIFAKQSGQFDLVITDMTMPQMTGDTLAREIKKHNPDIPIILCTGFSELMSKEKAMSLGISEFLMKPLSMKDLSETIVSVLAKRFVST